MSTVFSDGTSFLLACMAPSEPEASSGFQITFGVLRHFTNFPIALPAYSCHYFFPQFLLTHKCSVWNPGWEAPLLSEAIAGPPFSSELRSHFLFWGRNRESFLVRNPHSSFCCQELLSLWSPLQLWELWISSLLHLVTRLSKDYE